MSEKECESPSELAGEHAGPPKFRRAKTKVGKVPKRKMASKKSGRVKRTKKKGGKHHKYDATKS